MRIGRNDSCHCGSGKKYKKCCLAGDDARAAQKRAAAPSPDQMGDFHNPRDAAGLLERMAALAPHAQSGEMKHILDQARSLRTFMESREAIEAARQTLEAHRAEFENLMDDEAAYLKRARAVFSEEPFQMAWFTKEEVGGALKRVGYSASSMDDQRAVDSLRAAILHLADKDTRTRLSMILLGCLPGFVAAGRMIEGWIVQHCGYLLLDRPDDSNVFLFEMFSRGYDSWAAEKRASENNFLQEFGLNTDRLTSMSMDEIDAWAAQQATPEARARIEAVFKTNPDQASMAAANIENMERDCVTILEREDALPLMVSHEELLPWVPRLQECFQNVVQGLPDGVATAPNPDTARLVGDALWPVIHEMAGAIFTKERIQKLVTQLRVYRNERFDAGDKRIAGLVQSAIIFAEREIEPADNYFLHNLCFHSIRAVSTAAG